MVVLTYLGQNHRNNSKGLLFTAKLSGNYGVNGVGDPLNFTPKAIKDPKFAYDLVVDTAPESIGILNANLGGSYGAILPNANPSLTNFGLLIYEPGGAEKATNAAYTAAELAGTLTLEVFLALQ